MSKLFTEQEQRLEGFKVYLMKDAHLSESTTKDYLKRIVSICNEEEISLEQLIENIEKYTYDYTEGEKIELGRRSHNSYRSAIKQFNNFITHAGGTISANRKQEPRYHFEIYKIPNEHFGVIKLIDKATNKVIDTEVSISKQHHSAQEVTRDIFEKCLDMMFRTVYPNNNAKLEEILVDMGISMSIDSKEIIK